MLTLSKGERPSRPPPSPFLVGECIAVPNGQGYGLSPYFRVSFAGALGNLEEACRRIDAAAQRIM